MGGDLPAAADIIPLSTISVVLIADVDENWLELPIDEAEARLHVCQIQT